MIKSDGWLDWGIKYPGPTNKKEPGKNLSLGIVFHSMEGWLSGSLAELAKPERSASWLFSVALDGTLYQHYPVTVSCWASGNYFANTRYWSIETEGVQPTPVNGPQSETLRRIIAEWEDYSGLVANRLAGNTQTLFLHREVATIVSPNAGGTACPSQRYNSFWETLKQKQEQENEMTAQELTSAMKELNEAIVKRLALIEVGAGEYTRMLKAYDLLKTAGLLS